MKAGGLSLYRISLPLFFVGLVLTAAMMAYNHWVLPESNFRLRGLLLSIHEQRPMLQIEPGTLTEINERFTIYVRDKDDRTGELESVRLYQRDGRGDPAPDVIVARSGHIASVAPGRIRLALRDGEFHRIPDSQDPDTYTRTRFEHQTFWIDMGPTGAEALPHQRGERELNVTMLRAAAAEQASMQMQTRTDSVELLRNSTQVALGPQRRSAGALEEYRNLLARLERNARGLEMKATILENHRIRENRYLVELHKEFSIPVACAVFVVLGVPLATGSRRSGKGVSIGLSLVAFTVYYLFLTGGEKLADRGLLDPAISMWTANVILGAVGIWLLVVSVRENWRFNLAWPRALSLRRRSANPEHP
jgi:lipopolysaccharide export system permease protein